MADEAQITDHSSHSTDQSEVTRLARVYQAYEESPAVQRQWSPRNPGNSAIFQERRQAMKRLLREYRRWPIDYQAILEVGCGSGNVLAGLLEWGARPENLHGVDLLPERITAARRRHPDIDFQCANAERLDFDDRAIDLVLLYTVFSSILDQTMARNVACEIDRVLAPGGAVLWYDFRYDNPRNPHVRGMTREKIRRLFPEFHLDLQNITVLPPLARRLGRLTPMLYPLLARIPALCTHYLGLLARPGTGGGGRRTEDGTLEVASSKSGIRT